MQTKTISPELSIGGQPSAPAIRDLASQGVKTVINLRVDNEEPGQLSAVEEGQLVRDAGMEYLHMAVIGDQIREGQVDEFRNAVEKLPKPIYVHCAKGKRAATMAVMDRGVREHWAGKKALSEAKAWGVDIDDPALAKFVREYVESRNA